MDDRCEFSPIRQMWKRFSRDKIAVAGMIGVIMLILPAVFAPFIANGRPWVMTGDGGELLFPAVRYFFAPESSEVMVEKFFNFFALWLPLAAVASRCCRKRRNLRRAILFSLLAAVILPFTLISPKMDKSDYRKKAENASFALFAPIPYNPDEISGTPFGGPDGRHLLGCDDIGRDLAARLIFGARVSLAVGIVAAIVAMAIGLTVGMCAGFFRGALDLFLMRAVEILMCFPTFLLLLILMSMLGEYHIVQSIPLVIAVIGLTGWIGPAFLVRGEVLKESSLPYIQSCIVTGVPSWKIMFKHLLPNILAPVLISFTFGVAGAITGESALSFLGFGVQPPTASWGNLLRQAFDDPLGCWHLTVFPGLALFIAVISFNFTGEGLRRAFEVKEEE